MVEFLGYWRILDDPSHGSASLTITLDEAGRPLDLDEEVPNFSVWPGKDVEFRLKSHPWHRSRVRPYACDVYIPTEDSPDLGRHGNANEASRVTIILAIGPDVSVDDDDFVSFVSGTANGNQPRIVTKPRVELLVIRVMDATQLPELGEPILADNLLPIERWCVHDSIVDDLMLLDSANQLKSSDEVWLRSTPTEVLQLAVTISRKPNSLSFESQSRRGSWSVNLAWGNRGRKPTKIAWELAGPVRTHGTQIVLRLVTTDNVELTYLSFRDQVVIGADGYVVKNRDLLRAFDPVLVEARTEPHPLLVPAQGKFLHDQDLGPIDPTERHYSNPYDERDERVKALVAQDPMLLLAIPLIPLAFIGGPVSAVVLALGAGLSVANLYYSLTERAFIEKFGIERDGRPARRDDAESAVRWAIVGLLLEAVPFVPGISRVAQRSSRLLTALARGDAGLLSSAVKAAPVPLKIVLRRLKGPVLARMLQQAARVNEPRALLAMYKDVLHTRQLGSAESVLMNELELRKVFTWDFKGFRIPELEELYRRHVAASVVALGSTGLDEGKLLSLIEDPLSWIIKGNDRSRKARLMSQALGDDWRRLVRDYRPYVPLDSDVAEMIAKLGKPMRYSDARRLRKELTPASWSRIIRSGDVIHPLRHELVDLIGKARKTELSWTHQLDHPFEGRFIEPLAKKFGLDPDKLLNYDTAEVLLVPRNRMVASRMPGYRGAGSREASEPFVGYDHYSKTRRMETLIGYGDEANFTLQEIRDAHVFAVASLSGPNNPAIKMIDDVVLTIAEQAKVKVVVGYIPPMDRFKIASWRYHPPSQSRKHAMEVEQYIRERFLIFDRVGD